MSERSDLAARFSEFFKKNDLLQVYADGEVVKRDKGKYYVVAFCRARVLDGVVKVYSHKFIQVQFQTCFRFLPATDSIIFESEKDAFDFLNLAFVKYSELALDIPRRKG